MVEAQIVQRGTPRVPTEEQARFLAAQADNLRHLAFSPQTMALGFIPRSASRYELNSVRPDSDSLLAIEWPNDRAYGGVFAAATTTGTGTENYFCSVVPISEDYTRFSVAGIYVPKFGTEDSRFGTIVVQHDPHSEAEVRVGNSVVKFMDYVYEAPKSVADLGRIGIKGLSTNEFAMMTRGYLSFAYDLAQPRDLSIQNDAARNAFTIAETILRTRLIKLAQGETEENRQQTVLVGHYGQPSGFVWDNGKEFVLMNDIYSYPPTIEFLCVPRPDYDEPVPVAQYFLHPHGINVNFTLLSAEEVMSGNVGLIQQRLEAGVAKKGSNTAFLGGDSAAPVAAKLYKLLGEAINAEL